MAVPLLIAYDFLINFWCSLISSSQPGDQWWSFSKTTARRLSFGSVSIRMSYKSSKSPAVACSINVQMRFLEAFLRFDSTTLSFVHVFTMDISHYKCDHIGEGKGRFAEGRLNRNEAIGRRHISTIFNYIAIVKWSNKRSFHELQQYFASAALS